MSTPLCICQEIPANPNEDNWLPVRVPNPKCLAHEGVAAPLEPLTSEQFRKTWKPVMRERGSWGTIDVDEYAQAYAAAVSKNLQQENEDLRGMAKLWRYAAHRKRERAQTAESRILELEKEIAALRETK